jgi:hypothetical protein
MRHSLLGKILGLTALVFSVGVLLADSDDNCDGFTGFSERLTYKTTCGQGATGIVSIRIPAWICDSGDRETVECAPSEEYKAAVESGGLDLTLSSVNYHCAPSNGHASDGQMVINLSVIEDGTKRAYACYMYTSDGKTTCSATAKGSEDECELELTELDAS